MRSDLVLMLMIDIVERRRGATVVNDLDGNITDDAIVHEIGASVRVEVAAVVSTVGVFEVAAAVPLEVDLPVKRPLRGYHPSTLTFTN